MSTPAPRPDPAPPRRSWLLPAAAAAVLIAAGAWLLAPAAAGLLETRQPPPTTTAPSAPVLEPTETAPSPSVPTSTSTSPTSTSPPSAPTAPASTAPAPTAPAPATTERVRTDTGEDPPEELWRPVAEGFATDFATPGEDWAQRLTSWTTPELAEAYAYTDPTRQPSADLAELEVTEEGPTSVRVAATYAGESDLVVDVLLVLTPDGWRVTSAAPVVRS